MICGEADDGELSFPMIKSLKPDIVITDVDMPYVGGLELGKLIKRICRKLKLLFLLIIIILNVQKKRLTPVFWLSFKTCVRRRIIWHN